MTAKYSSSKKTHSGGYGTLDKRLHIDLYQTIWRQINSFIFKA